jgi:cation diffusion facilitator CzcD-associated flavoprotein CzcO
VHEVAVIGAGPAGLAVAAASTSRAFPRWCSTRRTQSARPGARSHTPHVPDWPGSASFAGELIHSARYRTAAPFRGRDVLVVGTANSGAEIAVDARRIAKALRPARLTAPPRAASFRHGADPDGA